MKNKVLVELLVPDLEISYNVYIPIGKRVGNVIMLLCDAIEDLTNGDYVNNNHNELYNAVTGSQYNINDLVYNTDIRNGSKLVLL